MLRISVVKKSGAVHLKLEGKLAHEWVQEAHETWKALAQMTEEKPIVVDLRNVSFVDDPGHELLVSMRHAGAELVGYGPMISALVEEIERTEIAAATAVGSEEGKNMK